MLTFVLGSGSRETLKSISLDPAGIQKDTSLVALLGASKEVSREGKTVANVQLTNYKKYENLSSRPPNLLGTLLCAGRPKQNSHSCNLSPGGCSRTCSYDSSLRVATRAETLP